MKKRNLLFLIVFLLSILGCSNKQENKTNEEQVYELGSLLEVADKNIDKTLAVQGYVTHTCKHSGKRCFIVGDDPNVSMRIEAKGEFGGFKRELVGSKILVSGTLKERRLTKEYIDQYEEKVKEKEVKEDGSAESCQAELKNIQKMRDWMKKNSKDYYSIYYLDGEGYQVVEEKNEEK